MPLWHEKAEAWHEILPGVQRRILAHGPSAMLVLYRIAPGNAFPKHTHPHAQYGTVLEGGGLFTIGDASWKMVRGDAYYVPPDVPHELHADPDHATVVLDVFAPEREEFRGEALPPDA
ncbi:Cupin 2, conserved barrel domain protein [mine drainage metagenome]|uniref:Cupin 2, conserved barrel domain protein n=1 Tax=mine drainage metagenome TaxID=410659 RepID=T0YAN2_9ZZZZ